MNWQQWEQAKRAGRGQMNPKRASSTSIAGRNLKTPADQV